MIQPAAPLRYPLPAMHETPLAAAAYEAKHGPTSPGGPDEEKLLEELLKDRAYGGGRIRCPKCRWQPRASSRWGCTCGHNWNTFDTQGRCPNCQVLWEDTQCLNCQEWSPHLEWYAQGLPPGT